jgi:hypothetical protein
MEAPKIIPLRDLHSPLQQFFVVMPDGHIKRVLFERNVESVILDVRWGKDKYGRKSTLEFVEVDLAFKREGWVSLESLYEAEDRLEDFAEYVKWSDHANAVPGVKPIDDEYLPDEVLRRRREHKKSLQSVALKPPKRRKAKVDKEAK